MLLSVQLPFADSLLIIFQTCCTRPPARRTGRSPPTLDSFARLGYNAISADGASALAGLLRNGQGTLENLELGGNRIGDAGAVALAEGMVGSGNRGEQRAARRGKRRRPQRVRREGPGLLRLGLSGNGIGCVGGYALANVLRAGSGVALQELELRGNAVSPGACFKASNSSQQCIIHVLVSNLFFNFWAIFLARRRFYFPPPLPIACTVV